jgi:hypothetical protein
VILVKGKSVAGVEPAIFAVSALIAGANLDHRGVKKLRSHDKQVNQVLLFLRPSRATGFHSAMQLPISRCNHACY